MRRPLWLQTGCHFWANPARTSMYPFDTLKSFYCKSQDKRGEEHQSRTWECVKLTCLFDMGEKRGSDVISATPVHEACLLPRGLNPQDHPEGKPRQQALGGRAIAKLPSFLGLHPPKLQQHPGPTTPPNQLQTSPELVFATPNSPTMMDTQKRTRAISLAWRRDALQSPDTHQCHLTHALSI